MYITVSISSFKNLEASRKKENLDYLQTVQKRFITNNPFFGKKRYVVQANLKRPQFLFLNSKVV